MVKDDWDEAYFGGMEGGGRGCNGLSWNGLERDGDGMEWV